MSGTKLSDGKILIALRSSRSPLAVIAGIESRNENLAAVSRFSPMKSPPMMVEPERLEPGMRLIRREHPTDIGPVDLLCRDGEGRVVAIEIKRRGEIDGVEQLTRYLDFLNRQPDLTPVRGMFVAQEIRPQAKRLAGDRRITCLEVDYDELRERPSNVLRLF